MKTYKFIKQCEWGTGDARLYELSEPVSYVADFDDDGNDVLAETSFVAVSAANAVFSGPETYIFPADSDGEVLNWAELDGSYRGGLDHAQALQNAGYEVSK